MTREEAIERAQSAIAWTEEGRRELWREDAKAVVDALAVVEMVVALKDAEARLGGAGMLGGTDDPVTVALAKLREDVKK